MLSILNLDWKNSYFVIVVDIRVHCGNFEGPTDDKWSGGYFAPIPPWMG